MNTGTGSPDRDGKVTDTRSVRLERRFGSSPGPEDSGKGVSDKRVDSQVGRRRTWEERCVSEEERRPGSRRLWKRRREGPGLLISSPGGGTK